MGMKGEIKKKNEYLNIKLYNLFNGESASQNQVKLNNSRNTL